MSVELQVVMVILAGVAAYLGAYLREKGKNLATREDIDRLTHTTEEIKAKISGDLWLDQNRWTFRAEIYKELLESLGDLASAIRQTM